MEAEEQLAVRLLLLGPCAMSASIRVPVPDVHVEISTSSWVGMPPWSRLAEVSPVNGRFQHMVFVRVSILRSTMSKSQSYSKD
jgi:hypothetical protein